MPAHAPVLASIIEPAAFEEVMSTYSGCLGEYDTLIAQEEYNQPLSAIFGSQAWFKLVRVSNVATMKKDAREPVSRVPFSTSSQAIEGLEETTDVVSLEHGQTSAAYGRYDAFDTQLQYRLRGWRSGANRVTREEGALGVG